MALGAFRARTLGRSGQAILIALCLTQPLRAEPLGFGQVAADTAAVAFSPRLRLDIAELADPTRLALIEASTAVDDTALAADLRAAYATRGWQPFWTLPNAAPLRAALTEAMAGAAAQGLSPLRHDPAALRDRIAGADQAGAEVALMAAFLSYARDLSSGQLDPAKVDGGIVRDITRPDPAALLAALQAADSPQSFFRSLIPADPAYAVLLAEKLRLEGALVQGEPPKVPRGTAQPGQGGATVTALHDRLAALGYLPPARQPVLDEALTAAITAFQTDSGMAATGQISQGLIDRLNRPLSTRLRATIVALERLRWMNGIQRQGRYLWVNIPDFTVRLYDDAGLTFESVTVVGEDVPEHRTPEFSHLMDHMVVNPSWNVPRSITVREYLPRLRANPAAVSHLEVVDSRGRVVPRDRVNFAAYTDKTFPYRLRQPPAERNALGVVKFMFPNKYNIYLHDTPSKSLFGREVRAFSHGCVRVGEPFDLAKVLLDPQTDDPRGLFRSQLGSGQERVIRLNPPVPIHLVYFTAWPDDGARIRWRADVYGRDARLAAALARIGVAFAGGDD
ncbi:murein L,D-transpeptidase [Paracoccus sp. p3-h83]|uniref:L,D-transpeptidase family protein n=1 Tax=Paracoccus sp. p3-h83 TaxID=3342805 RepID=UPI0035B99B7D